LSVPVTKLVDIIQLALNQYGIRFQLSQQQLVNFANMVQYIAFNKDLACFEEWGQVFLLGQDVFLETAGTYSEPVNSDIGLEVSGSTSGVVGKLMNYRTKNRLNKWIIEPPDGGPNFTLVAGETITVVGGSGATGVVCISQAFDVSRGPYRMPSDAAGNPPFRKLIGVTNVDDKQIFHVPPNNGFDGFDDYGLQLNNLPGRNQNFPFRLEKVREYYEISLVSSQPPTIDQTEEACGPGGTTINTSALRWIYYKNPPPIIEIEDDDKLVIPEEYRYEVLFMGISRLADTATYGDMGSVRQIIEPICERFWEDMRTQYQQFGRGSDWIGHGDNWDIYGLNATNGGTYSGRYLSTGNGWD